MIRKLIVAYQRPADFTPSNISYITQIDVDDSPEKQKYLSDTVQERIVKKGDAHVIVADISSEWHRGMVCSWTKYLGL